MESTASADRPISDDRKTKTQSQPILRFCDYVSDCMAPLIPALLGGGLLKVLLNLLTFMKILSPASGTYAILAIMADAVFFFLPVFLASTVAEHWDVSKPLAMLLASVLLYPELSAIFSGGDGDFLGLPVTAAVYAGNLLAVFLMVPVLKYVGMLSDRLCRGEAAVYVKPFLSLLITAPIVLIVLGPLGALTGQGAVSVFSWLYRNVDWLAVALLAALSPFFAFFGMNSSLFSLAFLGLLTASPTLDPIFVIALFCASLAQGGAALGVAAMTKDKHLRQLAASAGVTAILSGMIQPAFYGVTLKKRSSLLAACLSAGAAGLFAGLMRLAVAPAGQTTPSLFTLQAITEVTEPDGLIWGLVTMAMALLLSFTLTLILYRTDESAASLPEKQLSGQDARSGAAQPASVAVKEKTVTVMSPLTGSVIPLNELEDITWPPGQAGQGSAVLPIDGHLYAPVSGRLTSLSENCQSFVISSPEGAEISVRVGRENDAPEGKYFTAHRAVGEEVNAGDLLVSFDLDALDKEGFDLTTPVTVQNAARYQKVTLFDKTVVSPRDPLFTLTEEDKQQG